MRILIDINEDSYISKDIIKINFESICKKYRQQIVGFLEDQRSVIIGPSSGLIEAINKENLVSEKNYIHTWCSGWHEGKFIQSYFNKLFDPELKLFLKGNHINKKVIIFTNERKFSFNKYKINNDYDYLIFSLVSLDHIKNKKRFLELCR